MLSLIHILPSLEEYSVLKKPDSLERYMPKPCEILLYLDYVDRTLIASVYSQYGEVRYNPVSYTHLIRSLKRKS